MQVLWVISVLKSTFVRYIVIVSLHCEFPLTYPSESPPNLKILVEKGLSANQGDEVKELADRVAQENLGAPSIFAVAEAVKEWLVDNNIAGQDGSMYSGALLRTLFRDFSADFTVSCT
jgi:hypothetical protein